MRTIIGFFLFLITWAGGTTIEVLRIFQPLSLHGTDVGHEFRGEVIQAQVMSKPMVLSGAMPENLVAAIASPHQMTGTPNYDVKECNLLRLCGLSMTGMMSEGGLLVTIDLNKASVPAEVDFSLRTVLQLSIDALKRTLNDYHHAENAPLKVRVSLIGLSEKNATLRDLAGTFRIVGQ